MTRYTTKGITVMQARSEVLPAAVCASQLRPSQPGAVPDIGAARATSLNSRAVTRLPGAQRPTAGGFAVGRLHDWTGPNRHNVYVHCAACGKIFEILKAKGLCFGLNQGDQS